MKYNTTAISNLLESDVIDRQKLIEKYLSVRNHTEKICAALVTEDYVVQSMPDVSPTKWHLAHVSWFFEAFVLSKLIENYESLHPQYNFLFNSYYVQVGKRWTRSMRGLLSRPTVKDVYTYRRYVDGRMIDLISTCDEEKLLQFKSVIETGIHHEQQHQELILTDIKHVLSINPLKPVYFEREIISIQDFQRIKWLKFDEGIYEMGNEGNVFCYDNETPKHRVLLNDFWLADRLVTNAEFIEFIKDDGYKKATLWLSDGFVTVENEKWNAPLYWEKIDGEWWNFTLNGFRKVVLSEPVTHVSFYEADAFARWAGCRLPTEAEWEIASNNLEIEGNFVESENYHVVPLSNSSEKLKQMFGDVWEWTGSAYLGYPGYKPLPGAIGEYNGKFMSGQMVLRGGSCVTPQSHIRNTYRNFFPPSARWQFSGIRLAKDIKG